MNNALRSRIKLIEKNIVPEDKRKVFHWMKPGETEQQIEAMYPGADVTIFSWILTERLEGAYGPIDPYETFQSENPISPELEEKLNSIIAGGETLDRGSQIPRTPQETSLDREIGQTIDDLRKGGLEEKEIQKIIKEEESESDLVALTGGRGRKKRFSIDEGE